MRSLIFNICFFAGTFLAALAALILSQVGGVRPLRAGLRLHANAVMWLARRILKAKIEIRGLENLPKDGRPQLLVSKHQSELDAFPILAMYPDLSAIAMEELSRYPLLGPVIRRLDFILVSVEGSKKNQLRQVINGAKRVAAERRPILIYPEGELMRVGARHRYKSGVYHIYAATGCPATPVALSCGLVWPKREWRKNVGERCVIEFLAPIQPGLDRETFMAEIERRIEEATMRLIREHGAPEVVALAEERHAKGLTNDDDVTVFDLSPNGEAAAPRGGSEGAHAQA